MQVEAHGDVREKARVKSLTLPHAGAWLTVVPNPHLGLHLNSQEFVVCLKYRMGLLVYPANTPCIYSSVRVPMIMDRKGDLGLCCNYRSGRVQRHNTI